MESACEVASIVGGASGVILVLIKCINRSQFKSKCSEANGIEIEIQNPPEE